MKNKPGSQRTEVIEWLQDFIGKDKYKAFPEWSDGIEECSSTETVHEINQFLDDYARALLSLYAVSKRKPKKSEIAQLMCQYEENVPLVDTVDREFAFEILGQIAQKLGINLSAESKFMAHFEEIRREADKLEKVNFCCSECGSNFLVHVYSRNDSTTGRWLILECFACKQIDYKELPAGIKDYNMSFAHVIAEYDCVEYPRTVMMKLVENLESQLER